MYASPGSSCSLSSLQAVTTGAAAASAGALVSSFPVSCATRTALAAGSGYGVPGAAGSSGPCYYYADPSQYSCSATVPYNYNSQSYMGFCPCAASSGGGGFGGSPPYYGGSPPYFGGSPPYFGGSPPYYYGGGSPPPPPPSPYYYSPDIWWKYYSIGMNGGGVLSCDQVCARIEGVSYCYSACGEIPSFLTCAWF